MKTLHHCGDECIMKRVRIPRIRLLFLILLDLFLPRRVYSDGRRRGSGLLHLHSESLMHYWSRPTSIQMNIGSLLRSPIALSSGQMLLLHLGIYKCSYFFFFVSVFKFGLIRYGHLTWEWKEGIRSYFHPLLFAFLYRILAFLHLDKSLLMVVTCRMLMNFHQYDVLLVFF